MLQERRSSHHCSLENQNERLYAAKRKAAWLEPRYWWINLMDRPPILRPFISFQYASQSALAVSLRIDHQYYQFKIGMMLSRILFRVSNSLIYTWSSVVYLSDDTRPLAWYFNLIPLAMNLGSHCGHCGMNGRRSNETIYSVVERLVAKAYREGDIYCTQDTIVESQYCIDCIYWW